MPISPESIQAMDDSTSRLAAESMLAQSGKDDGLVPAYSLLGSLRELCLTEPLLHGPIAALHTELEHRLDAAQPFDEPTLLRLRSFVEWLMVAVQCAKAGQGIPPFEACVAQPASVSEQTPEHSSDGPADVILDLNIAENRELLGEFHAEAVDHLQQIEAALLALEQHPDDPEALNSIFRSFHTFKGNAGFLGLVPMQSLAHEVESLLDMARNREIKLNSAIITEILHSRDALQVLTQQVALALEKGQLPNKIVPVRHLIVAVKALAASGGIAPVQAAAVAPVPAVIAPPIVVPAFSSDSRPAFEVAPPSLLAAVAGESTTAKPFPLESAPAAKAAASATVRVNTEKLDSLMDVVGELVIVQSQLLETARAESGGNNGSPLQRNVAQLSRITKELQHTAMALRMIPIKPTFQKMERLVRDLARDLGKKVNFTTSGDDTELDRSVIEEIGDPLVHMVRNAMDHGIEPAEDRAAAGKSEAGSVHLHAYHQGSNIIIELRDDGRGIDPERIYNKAVEKGLVTPGAVLNREETLALVFAPGLSTAAKITSVSGRGVGMDVVKRNIERLRGKVEIHSDVGKGSIFKIKLPLTMAIIDGLIVRVGEDRFILPSTSVQRALRPAKETISTVHGQGEVLDLRGKLLPIHRLHRRFSIPHTAQNPWDGILVIVEHSGKISALLVDEMVSKQEVVIKSLGAFMHGLPGVAGAAILGDGNIALILDPTSLLSAA